MCHAVLRRLVGVAETSRGRSLLRRTHRLSSAIGRNGISEGARTVTASWLVARRGTGMGILE